MENACDLRAGLQPRGQTQAGLLMAGEADIEGAQAAQTEICFLRSGADAKMAGGAFDVTGGALIGCDRAQKRVGMTDRDISFPLR